MSLHQIYNSLHAAGLVTSQRQFSREWLQRQPSYYSSSVVEIQRTKFGSFVDSL